MIIRRQDKILLSSVYPIVTRQLKKPSKQLMMVGLMSINMQQWIKSEAIRLRIYRKYYSFSTQKWLLLVFWLNFSQDKTIGHFTQLVKDDSMQIGCAESKYNQNGFYYSYIVCNYGKTNIIGQATYESGTACSGCNNGCDEDYSALCKGN